MIVAKSLILWSGVLSWWLLPGIGVDGVGYRVGPGVWGNTHPGVCGTIQSEFGLSAFLFFLFLFFPLISFLSFLCLLPVGFTVTDAEGVGEGEGGEVGEG